MTDEGIVMMATHNVRLVILSVVVAIIAYTALELSQRVTVAGVSALRCGWLVVRSLWNWHLVDALHRDACL